MNKVVLDASAILALLNEEPGAQLVEKYLPFSFVSTVNFSEVISILVELGLSESSAANMVYGLIHELVAFDEDQAVGAAALRKQTRSGGLSFGDRSCLYLAKLKKIPVVTADKAWKRFERLLGIDVILIR